MNPRKGEVRAHILQSSADDFFLFQNRGYPRLASLDWVGNRRRLAAWEREILKRGVFSQKTAMHRLGKRLVPADLVGSSLLVDGHNVQITVESGLLSRIVLRGNDGALRDISGESARFRLKEAGLTAVDLICRFLEVFTPSRTIFLFDSPMSHSGMLSELYRVQMSARGLVGESRAVPVPENQMTSRGWIVSSSDGAVIDSCEKWVDLAASVLEQRGLFRTDIDFSHLRLMRR